MARLRTPTLLRRNGLFTSVRNPFVTTPVLQRHGEDSYEPTVRAYVKDRRREKDRVDVNKVQSGRNALNRNGRFTNGPSGLWHPRPTIVFHRFPGKTHGRQIR